MKLLIQIPCLNEERTLPDTVRDLPGEIPGVTRIEVLVIDDGSSDRTAEIARELGVPHVVRHLRNRGLAAAFQTGIDQCLELQADVIVNTDGDHQYPGSFIPALVRPILEGRADMVIGDRRIHAQGHLSWMHRFLQWLGSSVVRRVSGANIPDATSGFRALSREAALRVEVLSKYTYTLETILQGERMGLNIVSVPIEVNRPTRQSRLKRNDLEYVVHSAATLLRLYALYQPLKTALLMALPFLLGGLGLWARYVYLIFAHDAGRSAHIQSVVVGGALILLSSLLGALGILGDILAKGRALSERTLYLAKVARYGRSPVPPERPSPAGAPLGAPRPEERESTEVGST
jgi:glycosyltransferase involved in cell wall biosynthesis